MRVIWRRGEECRDAYRFIPGLLSVASVREELFHCLQLSSAQCEIWRAEFDVSCFFFNNVIFFSGIFVSRSKQQNLHVDFSVAERGRNVGKRCWKVCFRVRCALWGFCLLRNVLLFSFAFVFSCVGLQLRCRLLLVLRFLLLTPVGCEM